MIPQTLISSLFSPSSIRLLGSSFFTTSIAFSRKDAAEVLEGTATTALGLAERRRLLTPEPVFRRLAPSEPVGSAGLLPRVPPLGASKLLLRILPLGTSKLLLGTLLSPFHFILLELERVTILVLEKYALSPPWRIFFQFRKFGSPDLKSFLTNIFVYEDIGLTKTLLCFQTFRFI